MPRPKPRTGQPRVTNQPFNMDRLPLAVHDAINHLKTELGKSWKYIETLSTMPYHPDWAKAGNVGKFGFVDWHGLPLDTLNLFPDLRLPAASLQRWFDVRIAQVKKEVLERSAAARELAEAFVGKQLPDSAVMNAASDVIFAKMQSQDDKSKKDAARALLALAEVMQVKRANDIKERAVAVAERVIAKKEKEWNLKFRLIQQDLDKTAKAAASGKDITLDDINKIRERTFGLPALQLKHSGTGA